jgi:hypothetical protein
MPDESRIVRLLAGIATRDEDGRFAIPEAAIAGLEARIHELLGDPQRGPETLDEILRLANGALNDGGEVELARILVTIVLAHPLGRARLEQSGGKDWSKFAVNVNDRRAPIHDVPPPEGSVPLTALYTPKVRW